MNDTTTPDLTTSDFTIPDLTIRPSPDRHRRRASRPVIAGAVVVAAALVGTWVFARSSSSAHATFRTATAGVAEVQATLDRVATVEPVAQAAVSFPVSGTVSSVAVRPGDTVTSGQALGSLDTASLQSTLVEKEAVLAAAELTLDQELSGEKVGATGSVGGTSPSATTPETATGASATNEATAVFAVAQASTTSGSTGATATSVGALRTGATPAAATTGGPSSDQLRAARQAIVDAQKAVTESTAAAATALDAATRVCASIGTASPSSASSSRTEVTTTTEAGTGGSDPVAACQRATQSVLAAQQTVSTDQVAVTSAAAAYSTLLDERASSGTPETGGSATGGTVDQGANTQNGQSENRSATSSPTGMTGTTGDGGSGSSDGSRADSATNQSTVPSAADLIADQKAVDAAVAAVAVARQAVAQASIVSPIDGIVVSVGFEPGQSVTGGSSTETVVVVGPGGYEVATTVTVEDLPDVKTGQAATIALDGSSAVLSGEVVRIGIAPTSSTADTTYPVVVAITEASKDLRNGSTASVSIVTDEAADVLAVPTSAVTRAGDRSTVDVLANGTVSQQPVTIGAIGREWTEIRSGLKAGATVVLADLTEALPGSATAGSSTTSNRTGPSGGFGGEGGFVGGPPGGGPPG